MALKRGIQARQEELIESARVMGKNLSRTTFGQGGPDLQVTFADLEQFLRPLVEAMATGFLGESAEEQSGRLSPTLPCPSCGHECLRSARPRTLMAEQGPVTWPEPVYDCLRCERSFFPSAGGTSAGSARVQPGTDL